MPSIVVGTATYCNETMDVVLGCHGMARDDTGWHAMTYMTITECAQLRDDGPQSGIDIVHGRF